VQCDRPNPQHTLNSSCSFPVDAENYPPSPAVRFSTNFSPAYPNYFLPESSKIAFFFEVKSLTLAA
jgi:hypothetical protein